MLIETNNAIEVATFRHAAFGGDLDAILKDVTRRMHQARTFVARRSGQTIAMLWLTTKKPWSINAALFTPVKRPIYLLGMAVAPPLQRQGIGRRCLAAAQSIAAAWPAQAIRLDAYDNPTGAGPFYHRCGYSEVARATYRNTPLIYYERLLPQPPPA